MEIRRIADPSQQFQEIYDMTCPQILRMIICKAPSASCIEDILQDVYTALYVRLKRGRPIKHPLAYVRKITEKELAKRYRHMASCTENERPLEDLPDFWDSNELPVDDLIIRRECMHSIEQIVRDLPLLTFKCFVLYYSQDMPTAEIASALGISDGNVRIRLHRARAAIIMGLEGEER